MPPQHEMVMHLVRLPADRRDPRELEKARLAFIQPLTIAEAQLGRTRYIAADEFTYGDIPLGIRVHRWLLFGLERPAMPNIERWYADVTGRPAFQRWTADPAHHLEG